MGLLLLTIAMIEPVTAQEQAISHDEYTRTVKQEVDAKRGANADQESSLQSRPDYQNQGSTSSASMYELSVAPKSIQVVDSREMRRVERIKEMLSAELPTLETWP